MVIGFGLFRRQRIDAVPPTQEQTGGPPDRDEALRRQEKRIGFVERKLDRIARRVSRLEKVVRADAIAPLDEEPAPPYPDGGGR